jgi:hypothetical protein
VCGADGPAGRNRQGDQQELLRYPYGTSVPGSLTGGDLATGADGRRQARGTRDDRATDRWRTGRTMLDDVARRLDA